MNSTQKPRHYCPTCAFKTRCKRRLRAHIQEVHSIIQTENLNYPDENSSPCVGNSSIIGVGSSSSEQNVASSSQHFCCYCSCHFQCKRKLKAHIALEHSWCVVTKTEVVDVPKTDVKPLICEKCFCLFSCETELNNHLFADHVNSDGSVQVDVVSRNGPSSGSDLCAIGTSEVSFGSYQSGDIISCQEVNSVLKSEGANVELAVPIGECLNYMTYYICNECTYSTKSVSHMRRHQDCSHMRRHQDCSHSVEHKLKCQYCLIEFVEQCELDSHLQIHLPQLPDCSPSKNIALIVNNSVRSPSRPVTAEMQVIDVSTGPCQETVMLENVSCTHKQSYGNQQIKSEIIFSESEIIFSESGIIFSETENNTMNSFSTDEQMGRAREKCFQSGKSEVKRNFRKLKQRIQPNSIPDTVSHSAETQNVEKNGDPLWIGTEAVGLDRRDKKKSIFTCPDCSYTTTLESRIIRHQHRHVLLICHDCSYNSIDAQRMRRHQQSHKLNYEFLCSFCSFGTATKSHVTMHVRKRHPERLAEYVDQSVEKTPEHTERLKKLVDGEPPVKKLKLPIHSNRVKKFPENEVELAMKASKTSKNIEGQKNKPKLTKKNSKKPLQETQHAADGEKTVYTKMNNWFQEVKTNSSEELQSHVKLQNLPENETNTSLDRPKPRQKRPGPRVVVLRSGSKITKMFPDQVPKRCSPAKFKFSCKVCDYCTTYKSHLERHKFTHKRMEKPFHCSICPFQAVERYELVDHLTIHGDRFLQCDECDFKSKRRKNLLSHIRRMHRKEVEKTSVINGTDDLALSVSDPSKIQKEIKNYICPKCDYQTMCWRNWVDHKKTVHRGCFYECPNCPYATDHLTHYRNHVPTHSDRSLKPYQCTLCPYGTVQKGTFLKHLEISHGSDKPKCYQCEECGFRTQTKKRLTQHHKCHVQQMVSDVLTFANSAFSE